MCRHGQMPSKGNLNWRKWRKYTRNWRKRALSSLWLTLEQWHLFTLQLGYVHHTQNIVLYSIILPLIPQFLSFSILYQCVMLIMTFFLHCYILNFCKEMSVLFAWLFPLKWRGIPFNYFILKKIHDNIHLNTYACELNYRL